MEKILRMMKTTVSKILVCSILFLNPLFAQTGDTLKTDFPQKLRLNDFRTEMFLENDFTHFMPVLRDSSTLWISTRMQLAGMLSSEDPMKNNFKTFILNPLKQQYDASQSFKELKYFLGMVQVGGVAYLAYQHIKKYGFLKRK
jgi:hypothetical protein